MYNFGKVLCNAYYKLMQRLGVKKPNEIHQNNFPRQYFVVVYETPNCDVFFFLVKIQSQSKKRNRMETF